MENQTEEKVQENFQKEIRDKIQSLEGRIIARDNKKNCLSIIAGIATLCIAITWIVFIFLFKEITGCKQQLPYNFFAFVFSHFAFASMFIGGLFITYKSYLAHQANMEKENEYRRKKEGEQIQKINFETEERKNKKLNEKIIKVCQDYIDQHKNTYQDNLKKLKENVELYNSVKKIIEGTPQE